MQHTANFHALKNDNCHLNFHARKNDNCHLKFLDYFLIFAQNIDCGYGSNKYLQSKFWSKNKNIMYTPVNPSFTI